MTTTDPHSSADRVERPRTQSGLRFQRWMRVIKSADFDRAYRAGARARGALIVVVAAPGQPGVTRVGMSIGRRMARRAVQRNRLRRLIREAFRTRYAELPRGVDLIVMCAEPNPAFELEPLSGEIVKLANKAWKRTQERQAQAAASIQPSSDGAPVADSAES